MLRPRKIHHVVFCQLPAGSHLLWADRGRKPGPGRFVSLLFLVKRKEKKKQKRKGGDGGRRIATLR